MSFFVIIVLGIYFYTEKRVTNIYVKGNKILNEGYIIKKAGLTDYPKLVKVNINNIKKELMADPLIKNVNITRSISGKIIIDIEENYPLLKMGEDNYILSNGEMQELSLNSQVPFLKGEVSSDIYDDFIIKFSLINQDILIKISEVQYSKSELDNERFLLYMNDGNMVYITLSKIELINSYNEIYPTLEGKKGILYLDSGNHFEIKKGENNS